MYQVEATAHRPYATTVQKYPAVFLVQPWMRANDLGAGTNGLGKAFWKKKFFKKALKKIPQIGAGAVAGYYTGGGWEGAVAGGVTATIAKRKKGFFLKSMAKGALYGAAAGSVVGTVKETVFAGPSGVYEGDSGWAGQATRYVKSTGEYAPIQTNPAQMVSYGTPGEYQSPVEPGVLDNAPAGISWGEKAWNFFTPITSAILTKSPQQVMNGAAAEAAYLQSQYGPNPYFPDVTEYQPGQEYEYVEGEYLPGDAGGGGYGGGYGGSALAEEGEMAPPRRAGIMAGPAPFIAIAGVGGIILWSLFRGR